MAMNLGNLAVCGLVLWAGFAAAAPAAEESTVARTTKTGVPLIGAVGLQLSDQDVAGLQSVLPGGATPWLLIGEPNQLSSTLQIIQAYLPPTVTRSDFRRGQVASVRRRTTPTPEAWTISSVPSGGTETWAQVAIAGRKFDQILDDQDINRPFRVMGTIDDADLVSLVKFLRTTSSSASREAVQPWPIHTVDARASQVVVMLRKTAMSGQRVTIQKQGQTWIVISAGMWVA